MRLIDLTGQRFGRLVVLNKTDTPYKDRHIGWRCICDCGVETIVNGRDLRKGHTKSCGCWKHLFNQEKRRLRPFENPYNRLPKAAESRNLEQTLSYEDYLEFTKIPNCHYCEALISWQPYAGRSENKHGRTSLPYYLDRKDNNLGYTKENCVVCCSRCNRGKMHLFTYEQWKEIGSLLRAMRENKDYAYSHKA
jgi:hypothetical protein